MPIRPSIPENGQTPHIPESFLRFLQLHRGTTLLQTCRQLYLDVHSRIAVETGVFQERPERTYQSPNDSNSRRSRA